MIEHIISHKAHLLSRPNFHKPHFSSSHMTCLQSQIHTTHSTVEHQQKIKNSGLGTLRLQLFKNDFTLLMDHLYRELYSYRQYWYVYTALHYFLSVSLEYKESHILLLCKIVSSKFTQNVLDLQYSIALQFKFYKFSPSCLP